MEQNTFLRKIRNLRWQTSELQNIVFGLSQTCWDNLYVIFVGALRIWHNFLYMNSFNIGTKKYPNPAYKNTVV